ncbi:hypothetical protein HGP14_19245 [Rhizobium sp. P32RR-XVIII]|uniref:hypothetical protein n=1 Tax=Rhizobium sp. P32RR-XVIII TaxID=2726738 RepID=UPI0014576A96|nr:hypothetical protein [Rhizobium sp. P32RR-XVIII]NLS05486.1 hypothetical protein [Rhizobium sp. P32RR-XVIII]
MTVRNILVLAGAAAALAACVSNPRPMPVATRAAPTGVEGSWTDPNGLNSTFTNGQFVTRTTDGTNTQMASGTYTTDPNGIVQINLFSNIKRTTSKVNCALVSQSQLNCTSDAGSQFTLTRQM